MSQSAASPISEQSVEDFWRDRMHPVREDARAEELAP